MRKLIDKINGLEIIKIHKPDGELVAYQVEDRTVKLGAGKSPVLATVPFLRMAREEAQRLGRVHHADT